MTASFTISDRNMISKPLKDMGEAEREMLRRRVEQAADALDGVASPEFGELVALAVLEKRGLAKGSMEQAISGVPLPNKGPEKSSVFARQKSLTDKHSEINTQGDPHEMPQKRWDIFEPVNVLGIKR